MSAKRWPLLLPPVLALAVYAITLGHSLVWDDVLMLPVLERGSAPGQVWATLGSPLQFSPNYFRPLAVGTFLAELRLGGGIRPEIHHAVNLILHAINTALVVALTCRLLADRPKAARQAALVAGFLYAAHPALVEGVAFVSCRFDLLLTTFVLTALLADVSVRSPVRRAVAVASAFLLAALAKEGAAAFALVLPAWHLARLELPSWSPARAWRAIRGAGFLPTYVAAIAAGLVYLALRYAALGHVFTSTGTTPLDAGGPLGHLLLVGKTLGTYAVLVVWPFTTLTPIHWSELPVPLEDAGGWVALAAAAACLILLPKALRRAPRVTWLALAGLAATLPVANLAPLELGSGSYAAERFLLLPLALLAPAAAVVLAHLGRVARVGTTSAWTVVAIGVCWTTLGHWEDPGRFWEWAAREAPRTATPYVNLSLFAANEKDYALAEELARRAIAIDPEADRAYTNLGHALSNQGRVHEAAEFFEKSLELEPNNALGWSNLARVTMELGDLPEAERILREEALRRDTTHPLALLNLGELLMRQERPDLALEFLERSRLRMQPYDVPYLDMVLRQCAEPGRWLALSELHMEHGDTASAGVALDGAAARGADPADVALGRSLILRASGRAAAALRVAQGDLALFPMHAGLHNLVGELLRDSGDRKGARARFRRATELAPEWPAPHANLRDLGD